MALSALRKCLVNCLPYNGNHPRKKNFANYLLCHSSRETFAIQTIPYIKIPAEIKSARKHFRMLPDSQNSGTFSSANNSHYMVYHFCSEIIIKISYIVNWQVLSRVLTGQKQPYKMNDVNFTITFAVVILFIL